MKREEVAIALIGPAGPAVRGRRRWRLPVLFVLADGRRVAGSITFALKRDAIAFGTTLPAAPAHPMVAIFHDGRYVGTGTIIDGCC